MLTDNFDKLENLLGKWVGVERHESVMAALEVLRDYGFTATWSEISQYLEYGTDYPIADSLGVIEASINRGIEAVFSEHQMMVEGSIPTKTSILEGLLILQDFDDGDSVLRIIDDNNDPHHAMAELLELATTKPWSQYIDALLSIPQRMIDKIASLYLEVVDDGEDILPVFESGDKEKARRLAKFIDRYPNTLVKSSVVDTMRPLGLPSAIALHDHKVALGLLEPKAPEQAALELMGIALLCDIPYKDLSTKVKQLPDTIYTNMDFILRVGTSLDKLITEVIHG